MELYTVCCSLQVLVIYFRAALTNAIESLNQMSICFAYKKGFAVKDSTQPHRPLVFHATFQMMALEMYRFANAQKFNIVFACILCLSDILVSPPNKTVFF